MMMNLIDLSLLIQMKTTHHHQKLTAGQLRKIEQNQERKDKDSNVNKLLEMEVTQMIEENKLLSHN